MRSKALLMCALMIVSSVIIIAVQPATAAVNYDQVKYDPEEDAMRVRSGGAFKFVTPSMPGYSIAQNIEITKMTSSFIDNPILGDQVEFTLTVAGSINSNDDNYKYAIGLLSDGDEYIIGYSDGVAVGFELNGDTFVPLVDVSGNTLSLTVFINDIGNPSSEFEFSGGAVYTREEEYERFLDMAPDKLVLITEPSDMSTVNGQITVEGVVRDSIDNKPAGNVRLKIDSGGWESVSGSGSTWSYSLDTTSLADDEMHTIYVEVEGETLENTQDQIEIFVYQDTNDDTIYKSFNQKPEPTVGSWYEYVNIGSAQIIGIPIDVSNEMRTEVEAYETVKADGTNYDTYRLYTETSGSQDLGYVEYRNEVRRWTWKEDSNFGTPIERTITEGEVIGSPTKTVDSTTTYKPPLETHDEFNDVTVGWDNKWTFSTNSKSESNTTVSGDTTDNPDLNENLQIQGEALFYETSISVSGNTFTNVYAIRTQYENPGVIIIEYYSVDMGVPVRIDTFDPSRNLLFSLGLDDYRIPSTSLIVDQISFDPSSPKAKSDTKIKIDLKNIGTNSATGFSVEVMNGNQRIGQANVPSISAGASDTVDINWKPDSPGTYTLTVNLIYDNDELGSTDVTVEVGEATTDGGGDMFFILILIVIIVVVVVLVLVMMMKRKGAGAEAPPEAQPQAPVEAAAPATAAQAPQPAAAPAAQAATSAMQQETIQCPSCKKGFTVQYDSKPVKVKCPNCGMEGVLN